MLASAAAFFLLPRALLYLFLAPTRSFRRAFCTLAALSVRARGFIRIHRRNNDKDVLKSAYIERGKASKAGEINEVRLVARRMAEGAEIIRLYWRS